MATLLSLKYDGVSLGAKLSNWLLGSPLDLEETIEVMDEPSGVYQYKISDMYKHMLGASLEDPIKIDYGFGAGGAGVR